MGRFRNPIGRLDNIVRKTRPGHLFWAIVIVDLLILAMVAATIFLPREARLSVTATTERLTVILPASESMPLWGATRPSLLVLPGQELCDSPELQFGERLEGPATLTAQTNSEGSLSLSLVSASGAELVSATCADGTTVSAKDNATVIWTANAAKGLHLPFAGQLTVGDDVHPDLISQRLLLSGDVTAEATSAPFRTGFVRSESKLSFGDRLFLVRTSDKDDQARAYGIMRIGDKGALDVIAHATAAEARVVHYGQKTASLVSAAPTFWQKLQAQPEWAVMLAVGALLLNILSALRGYLTESIVPQTATRRRKPR